MLDKDKGKVKAQMGRLLDMRPGKDNNIEWVSFAEEWGAWKEFTSQLQLCCFTKFKNFII